MHVSQRLAALIVVDISGSMAALDLQVDGRQSSRLDAVKQTFRTFVQGGKNLTGRDGDLIGMVTFARYPDSVCPLTLDHDTLLALLDQVEIVTLQEEDGTAIGEGIALGVERLKDSTACSRVMILLTDGVNDCQDHCGRLRANGDTDDRPRPHLCRKDRSQGTPADDHDQAGTLYPPQQQRRAKAQASQIEKDW